MHNLATSGARREVATVAQFLILTGVVLPLAPNVPVTSLSPITPHEAWLAVVAVSTLSYVSYLLQRYVTYEHGGLLTAALGGLYSSTATTIVLARRAARGDATRTLAAGIVLASAMMYLRVAALVAVFDLDLAATLAPSLLALFALGIVLALLCRGRRSAAAGGTADEPPGNPLQLGTALAFALLFILISLASTYAQRRFGTGGILGLSALVGLTDIDPFVLSVVQGGAHQFGSAVASVGILVATASNNVVKGGYAIAFGGRRCIVPAALLTVLTLVGGALAWLIAARAGIV